MSVALAIAPDGSVSAVRVVSRTILDSGFTASVKDAIRLWRFCRVTDTLGLQEVESVVSFVDEKGMVRALPGRANEPPWQRKGNQRVLSKWCDEKARKAYAHWLAFKGPLEGDVQLGCDYDSQGCVSRVEIVGGSLSHHPFSDSVLSRARGLVGATLSGVTVPGRAAFTVSFVDLRAQVCVFDGKMQYSVERGPYWNSYNMGMHQPSWGPPKINFPH
jgi:hypothetical protein